MGSTYYFQDCAFPSHWRDLTLNFHTKNLNSEPFLRALESTSYFGKLSWITVEIQMKLIFLPGLLTFRLSLQKLLCLFTLKKTSIQKSYILWWIFVWPIYSSKVVAEEWNHFSNPYENINILFQSEQVIKANFSTIKTF